MKKSATKQRDLLWALYPLLALGRIMGIIRLPIHFPSINCRTGYLGNRSSLYTIFVSTLYTTGLAYFYCRMLHSLRDVEFFPRLVTVGWVTCNVFGMVVPFFLFLFKGNEYLRILTDISSAIDMHESDTSLLLSRLRKFTLVFISYLFINILVGMWYYLPRWEETHVIILLVFSMNLSVVQILNLVLSYFLYRNFGMINEMIRDYHPSVPKAKFFYSESLPGSAVELTHEEVVEAVRRLKMAAGRHMLSVKLSTQLNDFYGPITLLHAFNCFLEVSIQSFFNLRDVLKEVDYEFVVFSVFIWNVLTIGSFLGVLYSYRSVKREGNRTVAVVSSCILLVNNKILRKQLRIFSQQLVLSQLNFTACGLITLDYTLLTSMAAAIVNYLVVLMQFQEAAAS